MARTLRRQLSYGQSSSGNPPPPTSASPESPLPPIPSSTSLNYFNKPNMPSSTKPPFSSGAKDALSERDRVLLKKFGADLPLPPSRKPTTINDDQLSSIDDEWPGVVLGGQGLDDSPLGGGVALAVHRSSDTTNGASSQGKKKDKVDAGIAPWLSADVGVDFGGPPTSAPAKAASKPAQSLNHSPSSPHLSGLSPPNGSPLSTSTFIRTRQSTVSATSSASEKRRPGSKDGVDRAGRDKSPGASTILPANGGVEDKRKKSGLFGGLGLIKRKATGASKSKEEIRASSRSQSIAAPRPTELSSPVPHTRAGSSGLALPPHPQLSGPSVFSSKPSRDTSPSDDLRTAPSSRKGSSKKQASGDRTGALSSSRPPEGLSGMFALDLNLDHMEGIVDPSFTSTSQPATPGVGGTITGGGLGGDHRATASSGSSSSVDSKSGGPWADGLSQISHSTSTSSSGRRPTQSDISPISPFSTRDPFALPSSTNTIGPSHRTPPSPHSNQILKSTLNFQSSLPRRPSQLRNVNSPADELGNPFDTFNPIASSSSHFKTEFSNPFAGSSTASNNAARANHLWEVDPTAQPIFDSAAILGSASATSPRSQTLPVIAPPIQPPGGAFNAAWVAPESWGVEGDQDEDEEDSTDEDGDGPSMGIMDILSGGKKAKNRMSTEVKDRGKEAEEEAAGEIIGEAGGSVSSGSRPLTSGSVSGGKRPGTGGARPGTGGVRPGTAGRGGTSASGAVGPMQYLRVYRTDGTYSTIQCQLMSSTTEIVNIIMQKTSTKAGYKLFIRERSSDRPLDAREKPALIQRRRLLQAGFNESDRIEELGMEDLSLLCSFIYRMPKLPSVDSTEEDAFDSFEYVDLSSRDLQVFPIFLHRHAGTIVHLNLSKNPLQELPSDFIQDCTTLRELRMSHMALKRVPPSIRQSISLTRLDVSCNRIADLDQAGFEDIPGLMSVKVQNNRLSVLPSYFGHLKALKYLNISNNSFEAFPGIVCDIPTLLDLDVSFNALSILPPEIGKLHSLERLVVVGNVIVTLPTEFTQLENLREFDCRRNSIVDFSAAYALPKLEVLKAERNEVNVVEARFGPKMRDINLSNNSITKISLSIFAADSPSYGLTNLDLSFAKLSSIADEALAQLVSLATLKLDGNQFVQLPESIGNLSLLRELHCTDNALAFLPEGLSKLQKLEIINVHNNNLKAIPASLWFCTSLHTLNVSSNLLQSFPDPPPLPDRILLDDKGRKSSASSGTQTPTGKSYHPICHSLRQLYLADNRLTDDVFHPVSLLTELLTLNLSFNEISEIPPWTIRKNVHLVALYLSGNKLTSLPAEDLTSISELRILHFNGNKLQSLPAELSGLSNMKVLDVGSNVLKYNINNWRFDWNWTKNIELRYFNLSGNKRLEIKPNERNQYDNSTSPDIANFNSLSHLRVLGLMDITLRISLPDEGDDRRVRTSFSEVNNMAYGISDTLGKYEHMLLSDMVVPQFRGKENESLFGIFGRAHTSTPTLIARVKSYVAEWFAPTFSEQLGKLREGEGVEDAFRRAFLLLNKACYENYAVSEPGGRKGSQASTGNTSLTGGQFGTIPAQTAAVLKTGASGVVAYIVDKTLYVANAGLALAVVSQKGTAELLSHKHEPFDRREAARIRAAEGWISPKGLLNEDLDMSRGFGFYHLLPSINARPDVRQWQLSESDEFVILANKGLWDFMSYQTAVDIARTEKDDPMMAAQKLRDFALGYGADGSIMVMIIGVGDLFAARGARTRQVAVEDASLQDSYYSKQRLGRRGKDDIGDRTLARLDREIPPPVGMVALVFTDIKNSTALWETNQGMQTAIKMHNALLRRQLRTIGGYEVKTEGDAFMVSFPTVAGAVLWAFTCQILLMQEDWPREILECEDGKEIVDENGTVLYRGLSVRMGIHWGMPVCEADPITKRMDYFGPIVNRAARISGAADGGQITVSRDVVTEIQDVYDSLEAQVAVLEEAGGEEEQAEAAEAALEAEEKLGPHISQLRKLGFRISYMGEKRLKGLESPEKISLVYPTPIAARLNFTTTKPDIKAPTIFEPKAGLVSVDEVRQLASLCLRLEALSSSISPSHPLTFNNPMSSSALTRTTSQLDNRASRYSVRNPDLLLPLIGVERTDDELLQILDSLSIRIENSLSTLYLKQLGGFSSVLAALTQATNVEPRLISHALALFGNLMNAAPAPAPAPLTEVPATSDSTFLVPME